MGEKVFKKKKKSLLKYDIGIDTEMTIHNFFQKKTIWRNN